MQCRCFQPIHVGVPGSDVLVMHVGNVVGCMGHATVNQ